MIEDFLTAFALLWVVGLSLVIAVFGIVLVVVLTAKLSQKWR